MDATNLQRLARLFDVPSESITRAKAIFDADPKLAKQVMDGKLSAADAQQMINRKANDRRKRDERRTRRW